ncbi:MAG: hypothetical protein GY786_16655 [Proteobacteria bacterium]|nr:hypothetical protein [Pseudomonadota bacterium]
MKAIELSKASTEIIEILDKQIRPKAYQQTLVEILKGGKVLNSDLTKKILSFYKEAENIGEIAFKSVYSEYEKSRTTACTKGCTFCCHLKVTVTAPEIQIITEYINSTFSEEEIGTLLENLKDNLTKTQNADSASGKLAVPCGFLKKRMCTIYTVRPFACRAFNSFDALSCEKYLGNQDVEVPINVCYYAPFSAYRKGVTEALEITGFDHPSQELNEGMLQSLRKA